MPSLALRQRAVRGADSVVGATFLCDSAPDYFGGFLRSFLAMFRITIGSVEFWSPQAREGRDGDA